MFRKGRLFQFAGNYGGQKEVSFHFAQVHLFPVLWYDGAGNIAATG